MKQPVVLVVLITFVAAVSFVVASEQYKHGSMTTTTLSGISELPKRGDADGTGILRFRIKVEENRFCYELAVSNIAPATTVTINTGPNHQSGAVILNLVPPSKGPSQECVTLD